MNLFWMEQNQPNDLITVRDLIIAEYQSFLQVMNWNNYDLNETIIPVVDLLRNHAMEVLFRTYGNVLVNKDEVLELFLNDVFVYFPLLMQELAITRLIDGYAVGTHDQDSTTFTRNENLLTESDSIANVKSDGTGSENMDQNSTRKDTGTVSDVNTSTNNQNTETKITNDSEVQTSNNHSVSFAREMPEQSIDSTTTKFPIGEDGIPDMSTGTVQNASENFGSATPMITHETSTQNNIGSNDTNGTNTRTDNLQSTDTGKSTRSTVTGSVDKSDSKVKNTGNNVITEQTDIRATNKQYSYEITNFLSAASTVVAFSNWENKFSWLRGLV